MLPAARPRNARPFLWHHSSRVRRPWAVIHPSRSAHAAENVYVRAGRQTSQSGGDGFKICCRLAQGVQLAAVP
jgi:hypothetical protein